MNLINNFSVGSFCRITWLSENLKETWQEPLRKISQFVQDLEVLSVKEGQRLCTWQTIGEDTIIENAAKWAKMGLLSLPVKRVRKFQGFAHKHENPVAGEVANVCMIVSKSLEAAVGYREAFEAGDQDKQGYFLGFPECCRKFFCEVWPKGYYDPIWQVALNSGGETTSEGDAIKIRVKGHPFSNPMLRYCGIRIGFHIPHSFTCEATIGKAEERIGLARDYQPELVTLLAALLMMPMSWDCLHGIAVVRTPIFYTIVSSVPADTRHVVEVEGDYYPKDAARGLGFPFKRG